MAERAKSAGWSVSEDGESHYCPRCTERVKSGGAATSDAAAENAHERARRVADPVAASLSDESGECVARGGGVVGVPELARSHLGIADRDGSGALMSGRHAGGVCGAFQPRMGEPFSC